MNDQSKRLRQISLFESFQSFKKPKRLDSINMSESEQKEMNVNNLLALEKTLCTSAVTEEMPLKKSSLKDFRIKSPCKQYKVTAENVNNTDAFSNTHSVDKNKSLNFIEKGIVIKETGVHTEAGCSATFIDHSDSEGSFQNSGDLFPEQASSQEENLTDGSAELFPDSNGFGTDPFSQSDLTYEKEEEDGMKFLNRSPLCCLPLPKLEPSQNHSIMFSPHIRYGDPPRPFPPSYKDQWDVNHVRMPCSPNNKYPVGNVGGETLIESRWDLIGWSLRGSIKNSQDLEDAIMKYNSRYSGRWNFRVLHAYLNKYLNTPEKEYFFEEILPAMVEMALDLPNICTRPVPLLKKGRDHKVTLTQKQIGCLLLNAFFCTFPRRTPPKINKKKWLSEYADFPDINFNGLFSSPNNEISQRKIEKLKCLLNYFRRIVTKVPTGTVTFHRQCLKNTDFPKWYKSDSGIRTAVIRSTGLIETEGQGMLQIDFANKYVGGGVLSRGCVQEEIRFLICPELILSRLFVQCLQDNEVLIITGLEQFNKYSGYADSFKFEGDFQDNTPRDTWGRRYTQLVAMDAICFSNTTEQFEPTYIKRELNKAYCGFYENVRPINLSAIATGNWGCGAFKGNPYLKFLIQLMAASQARRSLLYFTFGNKKLKADLQMMYDFLNDKNLVVGDICRLLIQYSQHLNKEKKPMNLFDFIYSQFVSKQEIPKPKVKEQILNDDDKRTAQKFLEGIHKTIEKLDELDEDNNGSSSTDIECLDN